MVSALLVMFREALEAVLIVGMLAGFLRRTGRNAQIRGVVWGAVAGVAASVAGAVLFNTLAGGFQGRAEEIFEGIVMLMGAALIVSVVVWFASQGAEGARLEDRAAGASAAGGLGLFLLSFVSVLREGIESVLFLAAAGYQANAGVLAGAVLGLAAALLVGAAWLLAARRIRLSRVFLVTNLLLVLFAAGLASGGVHELAEAGIVPEGIEHVWDVNPPANPDGTFPAFHDKGAVGSILKGMFGWRGAPSLAALIAYGAAASGAVGAWVMAARRRKLQVPETAGRN